MIWDACVAHSARSVSRELPALSAIGGDTMMGVRSTSRWSGLSVGCGHYRMRESGMWRPTPLAGQFLRGEIAVPERVWTFNKQRVLISDATVRVDDIVRDFDYGEMMRLDWQSF